MPYSFINNEELNEHEHEHDTVELGYHNRHNPYDILKSSSFCKQILYAFSL